MFVVEPKDKENVAFLCVDYRDPEKGIQKKPVGTCFFVTVSNHNRSYGHGYLVTAKHVWESWLKSGRRGYVRFNKREVKPGESGVIYRPLKGTWRFHDDKAVDLAVLPWSDPEPKRTGNTYTCYSFDLQQITPLPIASDAEKIRHPTYSEGHLVYTIALLPQYHGAERNLPVVRSGSIALATEELIEGKYGPSNYFLVDIQSYHGHSGAPVWVFYRGVGVLLGVLSAAHDNLQEMLVRKAVSEEDDAETVAYYSLGITLVTPTSKLVELLESEKMKEERQKAEPQPKKPIALSAPDAENR